MTKAHDAASRPAKQTKAKQGGQSVGNYFDQAVFPQPSLEEAREQTTRLLRELENLGVSIDSRSGKVTVTKSQRPRQPKAVSGK
jgi:hypothetical protein